MSSIERFLSSSRSLWIVLGFHFVIWMGVSLLLDVHPDMADHWIWSRFLQWGYYEHPPMVALNMRIVTMVFGSSVLTLKIGSVLFSTIILLVCYRVGVLFFDRRVALIFVLILETTPYWGPASVFWHIDQPYMLCWLGCLYAIGRYIKSGNANWFFLFGVIAGLGALSKYIMILLPICLLVWCLLTKEARKLLLDWRVYLAAVIALAIVSPNLYWNSQNDWRTFTFVFEKGLTGSKHGENFVQFFVSQFLLFSLVYSTYFFSALVRRKLGATHLSVAENGGMLAHSFLLTTAIVPVLIFTIASFMGGLTDPHWTNVAYFSAFLLLARLISLNLAEGSVRKQVWLFSSAFLLNAALTTFLVAHILFRVSPVSEPGVISLKKLVGWTQTARKIEALVEEHAIEMPPFVISREYQTASALSLYLESQPMPHSIEKEVRNVWSPESELDAQGAILVCPPHECQVVLSKARRRFKSRFKKLGMIEATRHGVVFRKLNIHYLLPLR
ncbi:MAG: glycosyltransferase family 39 protein [Deltaproteobacteria bacterium]|nr:glycosyltransferase family 39 protein [Deltaproteobacteria bacterium]MBT4643600.1 glycosyltransferase family 39 protein [Deltaproteobacteria bacterium]MBT7710817.1 glycosyltransferase family 39 protein [Deltaproteobacteria bacterium]MBT7888004.1 glycosyltransferase family 39 protein [Deltaproteobacteria bacterium]